MLVKNWEQKPYFILLFIIFSRHLQASIPKYYSFLADSLFWRFHFGELVFFLTTFYDYTSFLSRGIRIQELIKNEIGSKLSPN